jgi:hypothetical protein
MYTTNPLTTPILTDTACELGLTVFSAMVEALAKLRCTSDPGVLVNIFRKEREPVIFCPAPIVVLAMPWLLLPPVIPPMAAAGVSCIDTIATANTPMINISAVILADTLKQVVLIISSFSRRIKIIKMMRYIRPVEIAIRCIRDRD